MPPYGIMFHHFHSDKHPVGQGSLSAEDLYETIEYLGPERIVGAEEWAHRAKTNNWAENDLCLTFDDALLCQYDIALPVLEDLGLTAFWFVYSSVFKGIIGLLEVYRRFRHEAFNSMEAFYAAFEKEIVHSDHSDLLAERIASFKPSLYFPNSPYLYR